MRHAASSLTRSPRKRGRRTAALLLALGAALALNAGARLVPERLSELSPSLEKLIPEPVSARGPSPEAFVAERAALEAKLEARSWHASKPSSARSERGS